MDYRESLVGDGTDLRWASDGPGPGNMGGDTDRFVGLGARGP